MTAPIYEGPIRDEPESDHKPVGTAFWIALLIGGGVMAFGIRGAVIKLKTSAPDVARWVIGADLLHDFLIAPIAIGIGWCVNRLAPNRWRAPIQAGLLATGVTLLIGWPGWRGYGRHLVPDNPSVQPLDYTATILTVWAIIWIVVAIWIALRAMARANRRRTDPASG